MEFLLFLLFILIHLFLIGGISYYARILFFQKKMEYDREEIVSVGRSIPSEILRIFESGGNLGIGAGMFFFASIMVGLWARFGGIIGSPHYAHSFGNYIFHFPIFFLIFCFGYSFLYQAFGGSSNLEPGKTFWANSLPFAAGLGIGSLSKSLSSYGAYHEMYFVFVLFQYLLIGFLSAFLWNSRKLLGISLTRDVSVDDDYDYENYESYDDTNSSIATRNRFDDIDFGSSEDQDKDFARMNPKTNPSANQNAQGQSRTASPSIDSFDNDFGVNLDASPEPEMDFPSDSSEDLDWGNKPSNWDDLESEDFK